MMKKNYKSQKKVKGAGERCRWEKEIIKSFYGGPGGGFFKKSPLVAEGRE
ncbi:MAG: hypothetical protein PVH61_37835 [Candidatus Aminicenantes bacterium]|jgi:hypothetical protein